MIKKSTAEKNNAALLREIEHRVLLILNTGLDRDMKVLVHLHTKGLFNQVKTLMAQNKEREAFNLIVSEGEVLDYIPPGRKMKVKPAYTLVEDLLQ